MNIIDFNQCGSTTCRHYPDCGWNVTFGGTSAKELQRLANFLANSEMVEADHTKYEEKLATKPFARLTQLNPNKDTEEDIELPFYDQPPPKDTE